MQNFTAERYHRILCPQMPAFLKEFISLDCMQRLEGVGLLCGTDWTPLFHNGFYYSRLDHSVGAALIVWNFTHDKKQTLAALFHDIATPAFSHVMDFKNGDALKQESTEKDTKCIINEDLELSQRLFKLGIYKHEIDDYHKYPIADNEIPGLSADRLEYMYPSGAALNKIWTLEEIAENYSHIKVLKNEKGLDELGFDTLEEAERYTKRFCATGICVQRNEDKVTMQLMADILKEAIALGYIDDADLYRLDEQMLIAMFEDYADTDMDTRFAKLFRTFRSMERIERSETPLDGCYCVDIEVKRRYVNPLVLCSDGTAKRAADLSHSAYKAICDVLAYRDSKYGCVRYE